MSARVEVVRGSVLEQDVEAVVNAANTTMRGGGGIDGQVHRRGGPELTRELAERAPRGARTSEVVVTGGHNLPQRYVLHVAGPVWQGGQSGEPDLLAACYRNCLDKAEKLGLESVGFCSISTGAYGYPLENAAPLVVRVISEWVEAHPDTSLRRIVLTLFRPEEYAAFSRAWAELGAG